MYTYRMVAWMFVALSINETCLNTRYRYFTVLKADYRPLR